MSAGIGGLGTSTVIDFMDGRLISSQPLVAEAVGFMGPNG